MKITIDRSLVEQALEALEADNSKLWPSDRRTAAYFNLRAALAEPVLNPAPGYCKHCKQYTIEEPLPAEPIEEPVAYIHRQGNHWEVSERELVDDERARGWTEEPLYTAPPQRKPLTEEEIDGLMQSIGLRCADDGNERMANHAEWERRQRRRIARAIERAHEIR